MTEVPVGWRSVQLIDTGTWLSGGTPFTEEQRYWHGDIPWISAASLKDFRVGESDRSVTPLGASVGSRVVPAGTVLFVVRGMSLKNELRIGVAQREVAFGQDCKAIVPAAGIDATFLALAIKARSCQILGMVDEAGHGTGRLPIDLISQLRIGIPKLTEQRRIARIIGSIDAEIYFIRGLIAKLDAFRLALIHNRLACCRGRYVRRERLGDLLVETALGTTARGASSSGPALTLLKMGSLARGRINLDQTEPVSARLVSDARRILLRDGDLLFNTRNTPDLVGKVGVWHDERPQVVPDNNLLIMRPKSGVDADFVCNQMTFGEPSRILRGLVIGTTSVAAIYWRDLRNLPIPLPDPATQAGFTEDLRATDRQLARMQSVALKMKSIRQGLMDDLLMGMVRVPSGVVGSR
jgi:type I restriction enzyme, S subunit